MKKLRYTLIERRGVGNVVAFDSRVVVDFLSCDAHIEPCSAGLSVDSRFAGERRALVNADNRIVESLDVVVSTAFAPEFDTLLEYDFLHNRISIGEVAGVNGVTVLAHEIDKFLTAGCSVDMSGGLGIDEIHLLDTHQRIVDNTADRGCVLITAARAELDVRIRLGEVLGSIIGRDERLAAFERAAFGGDKRELAEVAVAQTVVERGGDVGVSLKTIGRVTEGVLRAYPAGPADIGEQSRVVFGGIHACEHP